MNIHETKLFKTSANKCKALSKVLEDKEKSNGNVRTERYNNQMNSSVDELNSK